MLETPVHPDMNIKCTKGGAGRWDLRSQLYVLSGFLIRNRQIRFTSGCSTGLKIQRIQELGSQIPVAVNSVFIQLNEYIR
jgi:hypothetical protein